MLCISFLGLNRLCSAIYSINNSVPYGRYTYIPVDTEIGPVCFHCGNNTSLHDPDKVYWQCKLFVTFEVCLLRAMAYSYVVPIQL